MRDYKKKMNRVRLPRERYSQLREYCLTAGHDEKMMIDCALSSVDCGGLDAWIRRHVTSEFWGWKRLQASGIPCNEDTFRVYRAKFYYMLDQTLTETGRKKSAGEVL